MFNKIGDGFRRCALMWTAMGMAILLSGCPSIGPNTVVRDRFDYSAAIANSWKRQMLLNIVKLRYAEPPLFMDVASVINQYELQGQVSAGASLSGGILSDRYNIGGNANYADRPTITYQPLTGKQFNLSLLTPIRPDSLLRLVQAGYPIDFVFRIGARAINGIRSSKHFGKDQQPEDPEFAPLLDAMRRIQKSGSLSTRIKQNESGKKTIMFFSHYIGNESVRNDIEYVRNTLGLAKGVDEFKLVFGMLPESDREIAILSNSMLDILMELSVGIDVPEKHLTDGRAQEALYITEGNTQLRIHNRTEEPKDAFSAVKFQGHWFWIDNTDFKSKGIMTFMMILFSLAESQRPAQVPVVTVGAGQ